MPVFTYKGFDKARVATEGLIEADSPKTARSKLRRQGVYPTEIKEKTKKATSGSGLNVEIDFEQYLQFINAKDIAIMTNQLSVLLGASVPMSEALQALVDQTEKNKLKVVLSKIRERVNEGGTLADAMAEHPKVFDQLYISMIRAGERSGALAPVLERLSAFADANVKTQGQISSAMAYPILMGIVGSLMIVGIFTGVLPQVRGMFESMGGEENLPLITRMVFGFGDFMVNYGLILPFVFGGMFYAFRRWKKTPEGTKKFDGFKLRMPLFGRLNRLVAVSRFCRTLGTLLVSGVPIISALNIVRDVVGNTVIAETITKASTNIQEGQSIAIPLKESGQFPPMVTHMIAVGERTGELERMLSLVSDAYDREVEDTISAVTSLLGPLMIMVIGGVVGVVAVGLLLPMQSLTQQIM